MCGNQQFLDLRWIKFIQRCIVVIQIKCKFLLWCQINCQYEPTLINIMNKLTNRQTNFEISQRPDKTTRNHWKNILKWWNWKLDAFSSKIFKKIFIYLTQKDKQTDGQTVKQTDVNIDRQINRNLDFFQTDSKTAPPTTHSLLGLIFLFKKVFLLCCPTYILIILVLEGIAWYCCTTYKIIVLV